MKCKFCIGNDTGFAHLSINFGIETIIIYGDCPPQNYSQFIFNIDIEQNVLRSDKSIHTISTIKVINFLNNFIKKKGGDGREV
jgi:ADP-heptose:LPS heptosyltransferase